MTRLAYHDPTPLKRAFVRCTPSPSGRPPLGPRTTARSPEPSPRETCARDRHIDPRCRRNIIRAGNTGDTTRAGAPKRRAKTHLLSQILQTTKVRCVRSGDASVCRSEALPDRICAIGKRYLFRSVGSGEKGRNRSSNRREALTVSGFKGTCTDSPINRSFQ